MLFPETLTIEIIQEDIDNAAEVRRLFHKKLSTTFPSAIEEEVREESIKSYSRAESCPISQSLHRQFPEAEILSMPYLISIYTDDGLGAQYSVTPEIKSFMARADRTDDKEVEPTILIAHINNIRAKIGAGRYEKIFERALDTI